MKILNIGGYNWTDVAYGFLWKAGEVIRSYIADIA